MRDPWTLLLRAAATLAGAAALSWGWSVFGGQLMKAYDAWRYPPITARSPLGDALEAQVDGVRRAEVTGQFKRVMAMLDDAEKQGFAVGDLRGKLPAAAAMIQRGRFEYAATLLSSIEARVPVKRDAIFAAGTAAEPEPDDEAPPPPAPAPKRAPRARRPARRRR